MTQYSGKIIRKNPVVPTQVSASGVWTLDDAAAAVRNNTWPVAGVPDPISRSLRFRQSASAYLSRTTSATGNQKLWTWSSWIKRGKLTDSSGGQTFFSGLDGTSAGNNRCRLTFEADDTLNFALTSMNTSETAGYRTTAVFRDPAAWYHVQVAIDTANATAGDRVKIYINGIRYTTSGTTAALNANMPFCVSGVPTYIGEYYNPTSGTAYLDGYLTEVNFVDGQALTPSSFGTTDAATGAWIPMPYTGTYGTNGYYLNFKDNTSTTTLAYDYSGNSNNWTPNNISVTAGAAYDSMVDVPTLWMAYNTAGDVGATVRGNYCTMNPLSGDYATFTLSSANLTFAGARTATATAYARSTIGVSSGKWYWEVTPTDVGAGPNIIVGIQAAATTATTAGANLLLNGYGYGADGFKNNNAGQTSGYGATWTNGDVIGIALDLDGGTITFYKNNASQGVAYSSITGTYCPVISMSTGGVARTIAGSINFGQRPFTYTPPTGFKSLNTFNLPDATIKKGNAFFDATLYTGNNTGQSITNSGAMQPDLLWIKVRSTTYGHVLADSVRGVSAYLASESTAVEGTNSELTSFNGNGFTLGATGSKARNVSGQTYAAWQWNAGGATVSNNSGSIASQVRANPAAGFSVVTYTGNGLTNQSVGHGLGATPGLVIIKQRDGTASWLVHHQSQPTGYTLYLNLTNAQDSGTSQWGTSAQTSSLFYVGFVTGATGSNVSASTYVAYCWAPVAGYSAFGSYTGNGSTDGPFVHLGFRPRFVMLKRTDAAASWHVLDTARDTANPNGLILYPDAAVAEAGSDTTNVIDVLSNGFKLRISDAALNANGGTYIYACFAENPFKNSNAR